MENIDPTNDPSKSTNNRSSENDELINVSSKDNTNDAHNDACIKLSDSQSKFLALPRQTSTKPIKKKAILTIEPPSTIVETISDDISATTEDIKRLKHVQVRSNSTGKLYQSSRRVSFPENDSELVTGYLEPADPWACGE